MSDQQEPRNPFYFLLLLVGFLFAVTVLAVAVLPALERQVEEAGEVAPASSLRDAIARDGWKWVLYEVALLVVLGLASMGLDRYRRLQTERASATISEKKAKPPLAD